jgi:hypothetical protein
MMAAHYICVAEHITAACIRARLSLATAISAMAAKRFCSTDTRSFTVPQRLNEKNDARQATGESREFANIANFYARN